MFREEIVKCTHTNNFQYKILKMSEIIYYSEFWWKKNIQYDLPTYL